MVGAQGLAHADLQQMVIDPTEQCLSTLIHECLHLLYDRHGWSHKKIYDYEEQIVGHLSSRQWRGLIYRLGNAL